MKTKALVLGAHPPFEGPWVSLEGAEKWEAVVEGCKDPSKVSFELKEGEDEKDITLFGRELRGEAVRISLHTTNGIVEAVTAYVESVEE